MDVMRGLEESGSGAPLPGVENLMLHFTPYSENWSKLPVIVSGEGCYVTDDKGNSYIDGLAGLFTTQVGHGRTELGEVAAREKKELGLFPHSSFPHPRGPRTPSRRPSSSGRPRRWRPSYWSPCRTRAAVSSRRRTTGGGCVRSATGTACSWSRTRSSARSDALASGSASSALMWCLT